MYASSAILVWLCCCCGDSVSSTVRQWPFCCWLWLFVCGEAFYIWCWRLRCVCCCAVWRLRGPCGLHLFRQARGSCFCAFYNTYTLMLFPSTSRCGWRRTVIFLSERPSPTRGVYAATRTTLVQSRLFVCIPHNTIEAAVCAPPPPPGCLAPDKKFKPSACHGSFSS